MSIKLHNRIQTHLDEYSGEFITTLGKPSVADRLYDLKLYGNSVQNGVPTLDAPIAIQNVPSNFDITSCGENLVNITGEVISTDPQYPTVTVSNQRIILGDRTASGVSERYFAFSSYGFEGIGVDFSDCAKYRKTFLPGEYSINLFNISGEITGGTPSLFLINYIDSEGAKKGMNTKAYYDSSAYTFTAVYPFNLVIRLRQAVTYTNVSFNVMLTRQGEMPNEWSAFKGSAVPFQIKDNRGLGADSLHELCSLPSGIKDEVKGGKIIKRVKKMVVTDGQTAYYNNISSQPDYCIVSFYDYANKVDGAAQWNTNRIICNVAKTGSGYFDSKVWADYTNTATAACLIVLKSRLSSPDRDGAREFATDLINQHGNITFYYEYGTPQIYDLHPDELAKLKQIKSLYPLTNLFTSANAQPKLSSNIRKLGNRPFVEQLLADEGGNFLVDENGNNIIGVT